MWAPEDSLDLPIIAKINNPELLLAQVCESLEQKDTRSIKTLILEHKFKDQSVFWELILKIGSCITAETSESNPDFFDVCCRCLIYLVKVGNPKETLLALLEQMDTFIDDVKFQHFLLPIQTSLLKIQSKLFHSLDITLETVSSHLRSLQLPENIQLEGNEIKLFHLDETVIRLNDILSAYLNFLEPFISSVVVHRHEQTSSKKCEMLVIKKHLIRIFEHPLCYLILTDDFLKNGTKSNSRVCAELAVSLLCRVENNLHRLITSANFKKEKTSMSKEENSNSSKDEHLGEDGYENEQNMVDTESKNVTDVVKSWEFTMEVTPLSAACLAYLVHVENIGIQNFPSVFRHEYILDSYLDVISILLQNRNYAINFKGLLLCKVMTELVSKDTIAVDYLDNPSYMTIINDLIHIMIECPVRDHRTLATKIFPAFIERFVAAGRYQIYQSVLSSCGNSGLKGYLVTLLKNDINSCLVYLRTQTNLEKEKATKNNSETLLPNYFTGKKLEKLVKLSLFLPAKETTDMLENSDQIISCLNLLRFLILTDSPAKNVTGFWSFLPDIERDFLSPLQRGLELSKAHYNLELESVKSGKKSSTSLLNRPEVNVSVEGMNLPMMENAEMINLLGKAINTHHVLQSILGRVSELIDQQKRSKSD